MRIQLIAILIIAGNVILQGANVQDSLKKQNNPAPPLAPLKINLNPSGSSFFQAIFLNQTWARLNQNNDSTTVFNRYEANTFDVGLRRTRIQLFGQIDGRTFIYFQFGQNNYNSAFNYTSNRKLAAFFHDALCEYKLFKEHNWVKIGGGLTIMNGLSRFSQPSVGTILTMDVPVFLQYSVDQIDQFDRRLAVYARGQAGHVDYRVYVSNPFPVNSNGQTPPAIGKNATFLNTAAYPSGKSPGINHQFGGQFSYNIFENEPHTTPYMTGTYLGNKKIWTISAGAVYQKNAMWYLSKDQSGSYKDTTVCDMLHLGIETYLDVPLNKEHETALNFFAGYYTTNYGPDYLRYNGLMNPGTGGTALTMLQSNAYGNAYPMFGTGQVVYSQLGFLLPKNFLGANHGRLQPYTSVQYSDLQALDHKAMMVFNGGVNWLVKGHNSKLSLNYENRPTFRTSGTGNIVAGSRKSCVVLQYQIMI